MEKKLSILTEKARHQGDRGRRKTIDGRVPCKGKHTDLSKGDEVSTAAQLYLQKVQAFYFTLDQAFALWDAIRRPVLSYFSRRRLEWLLLRLWPALAASARTDWSAEIHCVVRARKGGRRSAKRFVRPVGGVAERTNALVLKTRGGKTPVGSNPTAPAFASPQHVVDRLMNAVSTRNLC